MLGYSKEKFILEYTKSVISNKDKMFNHFTGREIKVEGAASRKKLKECICDLMEDMSECENDVEPFTQEYLLECDPIDIVITFNNIGYDLDSLCNWIIMKNYNNKDPFGKKIWKDDSDYQRLISHPGIPEETREKLKNKKNIGYDKIVRKNEKNLKVIGKAAISLYGDNTTSHSQDSKLFVSSNRYLNILHHKVKKYKTFGSLMDESGYKLEDIVGSAHETCVHGIGIDLFKLFLYNWTSYYKDNKKLLPKSYKKFKGHPNIFFALKFVEDKVPGVALLVYNTEKLTRCRFIIYRKNIKDKNELVNYFMDVMGDGFNNNDDGILRVIVEKVDEIIEMCNKILPEENKTKGKKERK